MKKLLLPIILLTVSQYPAQAATFSLSSQDIQAGATLSNKQVFNGFGCKGGNESPELSWSGAPKNTKSFAITAYDPDAPTGSGWWHWVVFNIPSSTFHLASNAGSNSRTIDDGSIQSRTDFGFTGFGGACPPVGDKAHRYQFTVYALDTEKLPLDKDASGALVGFYIHNHTLASASIEAKYTNNPSLPNKK